MQPINDHEQTFIQIYLQFYKVDSKQLIPASSQLSMLWRHV